MSVPKANRSVGQKFFTLYMWCVQKGVNKDKHSNVQEKTLLKISLLNCYKRD